MNGDKLHSYIEPELEARIVALVVGEASDFEREELERLIAERPELAVFKKRIEAMHGLLKDVATGEVDDRKEEWKLSEERRKRVLDVIGGGPAEKDTGVAASVAGGEGSRKFTVPWRDLVKVAAVVALFAGVAATLIVPMGMKAIKPSSREYGYESRGGSPEGSWFDGFGIESTGLEDAKMEAKSVADMVAARGANGNQWANYAEPGEAQNLDRTASVDVDGEMPGMVAAPAQDPIIAENGQTAVDAAFFKMRNILAAAIPPAPEADIPGQDNVPQSRSSRLARVEDLQDGGMSDQREESMNKAGAALDMVATSGVERSTVATREIAMPEVATLESEDKESRGRVRGSDVDAITDLALVPSVVNDVELNIRQLEERDKSTFGAAGELNEKWGGVAGGSGADGLADRAVEAKPSADVRDYSYFARTDDEAAKAPALGDVPVVGRLYKSIDELQAQNGMPAPAAPQPSAKPAPAESPAPVAAQAEGIEAAGKRESRALGRLSDARESVGEDLRRNVEVDVNLTAPGEPMPTEGKVIANVSGGVAVNREDSNGLVALRDSESIMGGATGPEVVEFNGFINYGGKIESGGTEVSGEVAPAPAPTGPKERFGWVQAQTAPAKPAQAAQAIEQRLMEKRPEIVGRVMKEAEAEKSVRDELDIAEMEELGTTLSEDLNPDSSRSSRKRLEREKMDAIVIPEVSFEDTPLDEALAILEKKSRERDPSGEGVNIVAGQMAATADEQPADSPRITLNLKDVPLKEALRHTTELAGAKYKVDADGVSVVPLSDVGEDLMTRSYKVPTDLIAAIVDHEDRAATDPFAAPETDRQSGDQSRLNAKDALEELGIDFPPGASAAYDPKTSRLVVRTTKFNTDLVDSYMESLGEPSPEPQVGVATNGQAESDARKGESARKKGRKLSTALDELTREREPAPIRIAPPANLDEKTASEEAFSTFSLHVSDVSFKLAQAALAKGEWPEASKIRVEEFVNAFDYGDPMPSQGDMVACRLEQSIQPFLQQRNLLRVSMRTAAGRAGDTPLRLTFLLDNSGSMERSDRQEMVRRAFSLLADQLQPIDQVTLISFARQPRLVADRVGGERSRELVDVVANLPSEGGTNLEAALQLAFEKAREQQVDNAQNRVILLTDGAANLGDAEPESLARTIETMRDAGIAFDAAGIGADGLNDEILEALTRKGDGRYYLLDRPEDADGGFARQIAGALRPSAKNVKVQVEFNAKRVGRYKLLGFEKHRLAKEDFRNDSVDAAEMAAEEAGVAVYQFEPLPGGEGDVGSVSVRFRDLSTGEMIEKRWPISYEAAVPRPDQAAPSMRLATAASLFAAKLKGSALGSTVELDALAGLLSGLPERYADVQRVQQLRQMIDQAREIAGE